MSHVASLLAARPGTRITGWPRRGRAAAAAGQLPRTRCRRTPSAVTHEWASRATGQTSSRIAPSAALLIGAPDALLALLASPPPPLPAAPLARTAAASTASSHASNASDAPAKFNEADGPMLETSLPA